ncbi:MAG: acyltransferase [Clostridia bacterium]|nr:acyltransferase [Clostridia bacterium]
MGVKKNQRLFGPDAARCVACWCVLSVHFFLNNGFYSETVEGPRMLIMVLMRSSFMMCVPLFMILTGYLMRNKKLEKRYYTKGIKTVAVYVLASVACIIARFILDKGIDPARTWLGILSFAGAPYSWYIEMYLGLFLMIPFFNILFHALPSKKARRALIATMLALTAIPQLFNSYNLLDPLWWSNPGSSSDYQRLLPQWWRMIYPITYYFIGAYIGEYRVKLKPAANRLLLFSALLLNGLYNYWRSRGVRFIWGDWADYGSLLILAPTVLTFLLLVNKDGDRRPAFYRKAVGVVSDLTLGVYLCSYIFDRVFYRMLLERVPVMQDRLPYYFVVVPTVFVCSLAVSAAIEILYRLGDLLVRYLIGRFSKKQPETPAEEIPEKKEGSVS